ncbi:type IV pilin protein [Candidatus Avelusimicrobium faecicola]|uniref:type IV pilin protein n=1 Tax=Candidatus Avelusimicrobium faecicola TaxID=3416205 RepID=UPI003D0C8EE6
MNNKKGFTLIELLVVVLIIGILAAMAMPQYFKAVERSRMTEADTLLGSIAQAQRRKFLQRNSFTTNYKGLDVSPKDSSGSTYYTKGNPTTGANGNGFAVVLSGTGFTDGRATATRYASNGTLQYQYSLSRYYQGDNVTCTAAAAAGQELCADFCGIDNPTGSCCNNGSTSACTPPVNN